MNIDRNQEYIESMNQITLSDDQKEQLIKNLTKTSSFRREGNMKKKIGIKKVAIIAAACILILGTTVFASGKATGIVSDIYFGTKTSNFEKLAKLEEEAGIDVVAVKSFANGYTMKTMEVEKSSTTDDDFNKLASYKSIHIEYEADGLPDIYVSMNPSEMYYSGDVEYETNRDTATKEYNGITLHYNYDEYLSLPIDEEATDEERAREESDAHFFISIGSDERETDFVSSVTFELDNVTYIIMGFNIDMTSDDLFEMAENIIDAK